MCSPTLFDLGGGEVILVLALVLILLGAQKLPKIAEGFLQGIKEIRKAAREVTKEIAGHPGGEDSNVQPSHPDLMAVTAIHGMNSLILVVYEPSN